MKVCLYAGDMNLNRNDEKKYVEIQKKRRFFKKQNSENFFCSPKCFIALLVV